METINKGDERLANKTTDKKLKFYKRLSKILGILLVVFLLCEITGCLRIGGRWGLYRNANHSYADRIDGAIVDAVREKEVVDGMKVNETRMCGMDSIGIFVKDGKSGFYNLNTDKVTVPATYGHVWYFSEGLAAVEQNGRIGFIDMSGKIVIPLRFVYRTNVSSEIAFRYGLCVMANGNGQFGVIDRNGKWVVKPIYERVALAESCIYATTSSTRLQLNYNGEVIQKDMIVKVEPLKYATQLHKTDRDGEPTYQDVYVNTDCYVYYVHMGENGDNRCGLMDDKGNRLTASEYSRIEALNEQLFVFYLQDGETQIVKNVGEVRQR